MISNVPRSGTLYRFFDVRDRLLYIGITGTADTRIRQHASRSGWWATVHKATFEHGCTPADEKVAIESEHPVFNVQHNERSVWRWEDAAAAAGYLDDMPELAIRAQFERLIEQRERLARQAAETETLIRGAYRALRRAGNRRLSPWELDGRARP